LKDIEGIGIIYLDDKDIVRHRLVKKVIDAYKANRKPRLKSVVVLIKNNRNYTTEWGRIYENKSSKISGIERNYNWCIRRNR
jgi:hypothetical protein